MDAGTFYTVAADHLINQAESIEKYAATSHRAWILVGEYDRYGEEMTKAAALRRAAAQRSLHVRREILRNAGFTVRTPRAA